MGIASLRGRAVSGSLNSVMSMFVGSILAILLAPSSQKKGTPLLLMAIP